MSIKNASRVSWFKFFPITLFKVKETGKREALFQGGYQSNFCYSNHFKMSFFLAVCQLAALPSPTWSASSVQLIEAFHFALFKFLHECEVFHEILGSILVGLVHTEAAAMAQTWCRLHPGLNQALATAWNCHNQTHPYTVWWCHNMINFLLNPHKKLSIAHPWRQAMGRFLGLQSLIHVLLLSLHCCM